MGILLKLPGSSTWRSTRASSPKIKRLGNSPRRLGVKYLDDWRKKIAWKLWASSEKPFQAYTGLLDPVIVKGASTPIQILFHGLF